MAGQRKEAEQHQQQGRVQPLAARPAQTPPIDEDEEQVEAQHPSDHHARRKRRRFGPEQHGPKPRHYRKQHLHAQQ